MWGIISDHNLIVRSSDAFQDRGAPARTTNTTVRITILDNDDLDPKFTRDVYKAKIYEFYPMPVSVFVYNFASKCD